MIDGIEIAIIYLISSIFTQVGNTDGRSLRLLLLCRSVIKSVRETGERYSYLRELGPTKGLALMPLLPGGW